MALSKTPQPVLPPLQLAFCPATRTGHCSGHCGAKTATCSRCEQVRPRCFMVVLRDVCLKCSIELRDVITALVRQKKKVREDAIIRHCERRFGKMGEGLNYHEVEDVLFSLVQEGVLAWDDASKNVRSDRPLKYRYLLDRVTIERLERSLEKGAHDE